MGYSPLMLYRTYNVLWLGALAYSFLQLGFAPMEDRRAWVITFLGLLVFRYVVRFPIGRRPSR